MKRLIQSLACLGLALGGLSQPSLGQAQDDAPAAQAAAPDLGPVIERLDRVVTGLATVSGDLAKLQKASGTNANDKSLKSVAKQLSDLNAAVESLAGQLAAQAKADGKLADGTGAANDLLAQLIALQTTATNRARQPVSKPKWEYKSIFGDSRVALEEEMNLFGRDGWEFFNIASFGRGTAAFARRPVK